ncbi:hypothetical protein M422DRAFT_246016 [Sphaerobolus stellatus SS14]|nr:hypothetical protein M422DRAFT_246016 [Sphaerobolus stellatus SS14]
MATVPSRSACCLPSPPPTHAYLHPRLSRDPRSPSHPLYPSHPYQPSSPALAMAVSIHSPSPMTLAVIDRVSRTGHTNLISGLAEAQGFMCSVGYDNEINLCPNNLPTQGCRRFLPELLYKYSATLKAHTNFVRSASHAPSGLHSVSAGADYKVFLWYGTSGERGAEFENAHEGSVVGIISLNVRISYLIVVLHLIR